MNLLPDTEKNLLKKGLLLRFAVLVAIMVTIALVINFVALAPAYILARVKLLDAVSKPELADGEVAETSPDLLLGLPTEISAKLKIMEANIPKQTLVEIFDGVGKVMPEGVMVSSVSFSDHVGPSEKNSKKIDIAGVALDRKSLIDFSEALKTISFITSVDLPVSNLAKDRNLPFTIKIVIAN